MYLESIAFERSLPCLADPGKLIVIGVPSRHLDEVLLYMAALPGVIAYNPASPALTMRRRPGLLTLQSDRVYFTQVKDAAEGVELLHSLTEAINAVWEHRHELRAATTARRAPRMLDIWALLPRTNCRECGEPTCLAFAVGLLQERYTLANCRPVHTNATFAERRSALEALLSGAGSGRQGITHAH